MVILFFLFSKLELNVIIKLERVRVMKKVNLKTLMIIVNNIIYC